LSYPYSAENCSSYSTTDSVLAAWLLYKGYRITSVSTAKFPYIIYFNSPCDDGILIAVEKFKSGNANGNIIRFYRAYKTIIEMIHESKRGN